MSDSYSSEVFGHYLSTSHGHRSGLSPEGIARAQGMYRRGIAAYLRSESARWPLKT